jgi:hypothetical protein
MNGASHKSELGSSNHALHQKHGFLSFLGWQNESSATCGFFDSGYSPGENP